MPEITTVPAAASGAVYLPADVANNDRAGWCNEANQLDIDECWFDASDEAPWLDAPTTSDAAIPFTEDCRRSLMQLIGTLGRLSQGELISAGLARLFPGMPGEIIAAADSLYRAVMQGEGIDFALLNSLGLASAYLLTEGNLLARVASLLRDSVLACAGEGFLAQALNQPGGCADSALFIALAVTAVAARYLVAETPAPQRHILRLPAWFASLLLRASHYWYQLGRIAQRAACAAALPSVPQPALIIDSRSEFVRPAGHDAAGHALAPAERQQLASFSANATLYPARFSRASVARQPQRGLSQGRDMAQQLHWQTVRGISQAAGISALDYCTSSRTETHWRADNQLRSATHISTRCEATAAPAFPGLASRSVRHSIGQPDAVPSTASSLWESVRQPCQQLDDFISQFDPLRFPGAAAASLQPAAESVSSPPALGDIDAQLVQFLRQHSVPTSPPQSMQSGRPQLVMQLVHYLAEGDLIREQQAGRVILAASGERNAAQGEVITLRQGRQAISNWLFTALLNKPLPEYLAEKVAALPASTSVTVASLRRLSAESLLADSGFAVSELAGEDRQALYRLSDNYLQQEMVFVNCFTPEQGMDALPVDDFTFAAWYSGARYLADQGILHEFSGPEVVTIGHHLCAQAVEQDGAFGSLPYLLLPAALYVARNAPDDARRLSATAASRLQLMLAFTGALATHYRLLQQVNDLLPAWEAAMGAWRTKKQLLNEKVSACVGGSGMRPEPQKKVNQHQPDPCGISVPELEAEYRRRTETAVNAFRELDRPLIEAAFNLAGKATREFIFAPQATIYSVNFGMETDNSWIRAPGATRKSTRINLNKTLLFCVQNQHEERIYGLKALGEANMGYQLIRLDREIRNYITSGVLDYDAFGNDYVISAHSVNVADKKIAALTGDRSTRSEFYYVIEANRQQVINQGADPSPLADWLQQQHASALSIALYNSGDQQSDFEKAWPIVKALIPFYDCIEGAIEGDTGRAVSACSLDLLALIPTVGKAAALGGKFGSGLLRGLRVGGQRLRSGASLTAAGQAVLREVSLPSLRQLSSVGKSALRAFDPGFELMLAGGRGLTKGIVRLLNADTATAALGQRLTALAPRLRPLAAEAYILARYPQSGLDVPVKRLNTAEGKAAWVMVDPASGETFGPLYRLYGDELVSASAGVDLQRSRSPVPKALRSWVAEAKGYVASLLKADCPAGVPQSGSGGCPPLAMPAILTRLSPDLTMRVLSFLSLQEMMVMARAGGKYEQQAVRVFTAREHNGGITRQQLIHQAVEQDNADIVRFLRSGYFQPPVAITAATVDGNTILTDCAVRGSGQLMRDILALPDLDINQLTSGGNSALILAARANNHGAIRELLKQPHLNINRVNQRGESALMVAAAAGYRQSVALLLAAPGIKRNIANGEGLTALGLATRANKHEVVSLLRSPSAAVDAAPAAVPRIQHAVDAALSAMPEALQHYYQEIKRYLAAVKESGCRPESNTRLRRCISPALPAMLASLPQEMLGEIFSYLTPNELFTLSELGGRYEAEAMRVFSYLDGNAPLVDNRARQKENRAAEIDAEAITALQQGKLDSWQQLTTLANQLRQQAAAMRTAACIEVPGQRLRFKIIARAIENDDAATIRHLKSSYLQPPFDFQQVMPAGNIQGALPFLAGQPDWVFLPVTTEIAPLSYCAMRGGARAMREMLATPGTAVNFATAAGDTLLMLAVKHNNQPTLEVLLQQPAINIAAVNPQGASALGLADSYDRVNVVRRLLDALAAKETIPDEYSGYLLTIAAKYNDARLVKRVLLKDQSTMSVTNINGDTALILAVRYQHENIVAMLANAPATDINMADARGSSALTLAASTGNEKIVDMLLKKPAIEVNKPDGHHNTPLILAAREGHADIVKRLLRVPKIAVNASNLSGETALTIAARQGHSAIVRQLLEVRELAINAVNGRGVSALMIAASLGHTRIVKLLLDTKRISTQATNGRGENALMLAAREGHAAVVSLLLEADAQAVQGVSQAGETALSLAAMAGHQRVIKLLLEKGAVDINSANAQGATALMLAARYGRNQLVSSLLAWPQVDINAVNHRGECALTIANRHGHKAIVGQLLAAGPVKEGATDIADRDNILLVAARYGDDTVVRRLLTMPALNINAVDNNGDSALILAAAGGYKNIVQLLLAAPMMNINAVNRAGQSALLLATLYNRENIVALLLSQPAINVNSVDAVKNSALMAAAYKGYISIAARLLTHPEVNRKLINVFNQDAENIAKSSGHQEVAALFNGDRQ